MIVSRKYVFVALFIVFGLAPLLMGECCNCPPQICFELDLGNCPQLANAKLKMNRYDIEYIETNSGVFANKFVAETKEDFTSPHNEKYVSGKHRTCLGSWDEKVSCSWRELYRHANGVYPTEAQLAAMTELQAHDWFRDKYKELGCSIIGDQYPDIYYTSEVRPVGSPLCFTYPNPLPSHTISEGDQGPFPFEGEITMPNGQKCKLETMSWPLKPQNGQNITMKVRPKSPCAPCN